MLEVVGAVTVGLVGLAISLVLLALVKAYVEAALGFLRFAAICHRKGRGTWGGTRRNPAAPRPPLYALRMIHFQAWHARDWDVDGVLIPWTIARPIGKASRFYPA